MNQTRRRFLLSAAAAAASAAATSAPAFTRRTIARQGAVASEKHFQIKNIQRSVHRMEFREVPRRNMDREIPHWRYSDLCRVTLQCGTTGIGETLMYYTWGATGEEDVQRAIGKNALDLLWDDSLGAGLQMALFDAVGRATELPVHSLLGEQIHQSTPLSWWNIDTSAADMAAECRTALQQGYMSYKTKGRPWFDVFKQVSQAAAAVPPEFKIDMDFNDTLRDADRGLPILKRLAEYPQVDIYETPIPQDDVEGNRRIAEATHVKIAMHYGNPAPATVVRTGCCDGFVAGGGASKLLAIGRFCEQTELPLWLQLVGSGITAAFSLHFGGVLQQAVWPAVNCHQLFETSLLTSPIIVRGGKAEVPSRPGLGFDLNEDAAARIAVDRPESRPDPERLIETNWADGRRMYTASNGQINFMLAAANSERYPYFADGADTRLVPNDGTPAWRKIYDQARHNGPIEA